MFMQDRIMRILKVSLALAGFAFWVVAGTALAASQASPAGFKSYGLKDPLNGASVPELVGRIISWVLPVVGSLFLVMLIWGGFTYLTASGESDRVKKATTTLKNAVIGLVIVALAYVLVFNLISSFGKALNGGTGSPPGAPTPEAQTAG
jgi:TRAP-type C4-dicarboxylate transport system permease small subunit